MAKVKLTVDGYRCERCGAEWIPRYHYADGSGTVPPKVCPRCKSPYWDRPRRAPHTGAADDGEGPR